MDSFQYGKVLYSLLDDIPVTVEEFVPGEFQKYVNSNGACLTSPVEACDEVFAKAQCLVHYSYVFTKRKMMLVDLQGSMFQLYDPEIATTEFGQYKMQTADCRLQTADRVQNAD